MSRQDRLREYAAEKGPKGAGRDQKNLDYWAERASENSYHGSDDKGARDTGKRAEAKADKNEVGSSFMRGTRREA